MRQDTTTVTDKIDAMVHRIVERFDPDQIILFGSYARGTARPDSDVYLLVIMPVTGSKREKQIDLCCALHDIHVANDFKNATFTLQMREDCPTDTICFQQQQSD